MSDVSPYAKIRELSAHIESLQRVAKLFIVCTFALLILGGAYLWTHACH